MRENTEQEKLRIWTLLTQELLKASTYLKQIYLTQVCTFQSNQIKIASPIFLLLLKRFIVHLSTTLNPRKPKAK